MQLFGADAASYYRLAASLGPLLIAVSIYMHIAVSVKRLHDCGYTGLFALALLVPVVNLAFTIWAGILPGQPGPNRFGVAPNIQPA